MSTSKSLWCIEENKKCVWVCNLFNEMRGHCYKDYTSDL